MARADLRTHAHTTPARTSGPGWEQLVDRALGAHASDLHMHVDRDNHAVVRARLDGVMVPWAELPPDVVVPALTRIKAAADLGTGQSLLVSEGRLRHDGPTGPVDMRLTITPLVGGATKVTVRLPALDTALRLDQLGFSADNLERVNEALTYPDGLVLATGPVGAGKTTTLLAAIDHVGGPGRAVITVEDPVERVVPGADQIEVRDKAGLTYEHILKSLLRMDLDVLLIGEIRDPSTARNAVQIAKAGRLVLSTLHAGTPVEALLRLHELSGLGPLEVSESVRAVISQRLIRKVHDECGGTQCAGCLWTGWSGRVPVHEVLLVDDVMRDRLLRRAPASELNRVARTAGMRTFHEDAERWVSSGTTTAAEIERVLGRG